MLALHNVRPAVERAAADLGGQVRVVKVNAATDSQLLNALKVAAVSMIVLYGEYGRELGRSVVVENRAGAEGIIAMQTLARAQPDGNTIGFAAVRPFSITPHVQRLPFALDAITPLMVVMYSPAVLVTTPALRVKNIQEMVAAAKAKAGMVRAGNSGSVSLGTLIFHELHKSAGIDITVVPYKGGGQLLTDAIGGQFELLVMNINATVVQSINEGKLTALAVSGPGRLPSLAGVPTLAEQGYPSADLISAFGLFLPAKVPQETVDALSKSVNEVIADPLFQARLAEMG